MHSKHFSEKELSCPCCGQNNVTPDLLDLAEVIRRMLNEPMIVHSAYRCKKHNAEVGGQPKSKHLTGQAMDFYVNGMSPAALYNTIVKAWHDGKLPLLGGIGLYNWGVHIDTMKAQDGHLRTWDLRK